MMHTQGGKGERVSVSTETEGVVARMMGIDEGGEKMERLEVNSPK